MKKKSSELFPTIGIECHVQLNSVSKLFSGASNDDRGADANTLVNHIDFGLPGALPVLNNKIMDLAIRAALALNARPELYSAFDRKHYFYPDLPMGYQITQYARPVIANGYVEYWLDGKLMKVGITRAHLEADAGKSTHPVGTDYSLVDLNRAGTPLLEIVSEPEMHSAAEAKAYARELYLVMRYAEVTNGDLYHGNMRFDVNVSLGSGNQLGVRTETKNLNSFRAVEKAVEYEIKRQKEILDSGQSIVQETRGWDDAKAKTFTQRVKENADDYRYMPDPDLPPVIISDKQIDHVAGSMKHTPSFWRKELTKLEVTSAHAETLLEANLDFPEAKYLDLVRSFNDLHEDSKQLINWLVNVDIPLMREGADTKRTKRELIYLPVSRLVRANKLSSTNAKALIVNLLNERTMIKDVEAYAAEAGLIQQSDQKELTAVVDAVISGNQKAVEDVLAGEEKAIGFLVGQVMARTKGQANPSLARELLVKQMSDNKLRLIK